MKILKTTKIYNNRIYLPLEVREKLKVSNGDKIIFGINYDQEIVLFTNKEEKKHSRFEVSTKDSPHKT
nr:MAG: AbrB family transcriptional regulator [uncultured archaeon]